MYRFDLRILPVWLNGTMFANTLIERSRSTYSGTSIIEISIIQARAGRLLSIMGLIMTVSEHHDVEMSCRIIVL